MNRHTPYHQIPPIPTDVIDFLIDTFIHPLGSDMNVSELPIAYGRQQGHQDVINVLRSINAMQTGV